jgi:hypothetical protein
MHNSITGNRNRIVVVIRPNQKHRKELILFKGFKINNWKSKTYFKKLNFSGFSGKFGCFKNITIFVTS